MTDRRELARLKARLAAWDPEREDLPDDLALALDVHPELRLAFDLRFSAWRAAPEALDPPAALERLLPPREPPATAPVVAPRRRRWIGPAALAAAALIALGVGGIAATAFLTTGAHLAPEPTVAAIDLPDRASPGDLWPVDAGASLPGAPSADPGADGFVQTAVDPVSTFAIDVDGASWSVARRSLRNGFLPPTASVRVEEFANRIDPGLPQPEVGPFAVTFEAAPSPWAPGRDYVRIGLAARSPTTRTPAHLTFLIDTSGSMASPDKLPLVRHALTTLVEQLGDGDTVAIVTYSGAAGVLLPPTPATERAAILAALERLEARGSTAMGDGISRAYALAQATARPDHVNRVILASDGDANVGLTDPDRLVALLRGSADRGITLTTLGFGNARYRDATMERLADHGDGNYFYVDGPEEARRVFVDALTSTLEVVARDVKLQVAWNPETVSRYRLLGYENRAIADADFRDDAVDAGELGAGHRVVAFYEIERVPGARGDLATVRTRAEAPGPQGEAVEAAWTLPVGAVAPRLADTSAGFRLGLAAATFAERLRGSEKTGDVSYSRLEHLAHRAARVDHPEDRELIELLGRARALARELPCTEVQLLDRSPPYWVDEDGQPCD